jgi:ribosomal protein L32
MDKYVVSQGIRPCPKCGEPSLQHHVCSACGFYKGKEVIEIPLE